MASRNDRFPRDGSASTDKTEPAHIFYEREDESPLTAKLVQWGGSDGIVTFDGMFPRAMTSSPGLPPGTDKDIAFLKALDLKYEIYSGAATAYPKPFLCVPKQQYGDKMPTAADIVRDLRNETRFSSKIEDMSKEELPYLGYEPNFRDEVHTDREKQFIFSTGKEDATVEENTIVEGDMQIHVELEAVVKKNRLYYALFHCKPFDCDGTMMVNYVYLFAVGVSIHSGNLVGLLGMQACHNLCD